MQTKILKRTVAPRSARQPLKTFAQRQQAAFQQHFAGIVGASAPDYQRYEPGKLEDLAFQRKLVDACVAHPQKFWAGEFATGIGKSVIAARIAARYIDRGPVLYVSPSAASIGDVTEGVIEKFDRGLRLEGCEHAALGALNDFSLAHDVSFVTPWSLAKLIERDGARVRKMLGKLSCMIVDEAHRFPEVQSEDELVVYGKIFEAAQRVQGRVVVLTGTWHRLDQRKIMGIDAPVSRISVQDAVTMGRCAELWSTQVIMKIAGRAKQTGDYYDFHLSAPERKKYLREVAGYVQRAHATYPAPFAVFARSVADAETIARVFNRETGLGKRGIAVMTGRTLLAQRKDIIARIRAGAVAGYATCAVGEEAIDIPELAVVHLVRRTTSIVKNMQAIGRALRVSPGKKAVVVDYQCIIEDLREHFVGVTLDEIAKTMGAEGRVRNGEPMVRQTQRRDARFGGSTQEEERALVLAEYQAEREAVKRAQEAAAAGERAHAGAQKRAEIRKRAEKVVGMLKSRNVEEPEFGWAGWIDRVVEKLAGVPA